MGCGLKTLVIRMSKLGHTAIRRRRVTSALLNGPVQLKGTFRYDGQYQRSPFVPAENLSADLIHHITSKGNRDIESPKCDIFMMME